MDSPVPRGFGDFQSEPNAWYEIPLNAPENEEVGVRSDMDAEGQRGLCSRYFVRARLPGGDQLVHQPAHPGFAWEVAMGGTPLLQAERMLSFTRRGERKKEKKKERERDSHSVVSDSLQPHGL